MGSLDNLSLAVDHLGSGDAEDGFYEPDSSPNMSLSSITSEGLSPQRFRTEPLPELTLPGSEGAPITEQPPESTVMPQPTTSNDYHTILRQMFPGVDDAYLEVCCQYCDSDEEFQHIIASLLDVSDLPQKQTGQEHPFFEDAEPNPYVKRLAEMFSNMSLEDLERQCGECASDADFNTLVLQIAESTLEMPTETSFGTAEDENSSTEAFVSARGSTAPTSPEQHPHLMELVEMFPNNSIHDLECHVAQYDADSSLGTLADTVLAMEAAVVKADQAKSSQRLMLLAEMFPHIEIAVLEQRCDEMGTDESLDSLVEALMADEKPVVEENASVIDQQRTANLMDLAIVFPDIEIEELQDICKEHDPDVSLNTLVSYVMNSRDLLDPEQGAAALPLPEEDLEQLDAYEMLLNILPNADPDFLREKFESFAGDDGALKRFTEDALENQNYPTNQDYTVRRQKVRVQLQYREKFHPKYYLEEIPDPFDHFGKKTFVGTTKPQVNQEKAFLKSRYRDVDEDTINRVYKQEGFSLYKTCKQLDCYEGPLTATRESNDFVDCYDDIVSRELLQEIALIINEKGIRQYMMDRDAAKERALEQARIKNELLECNCCCNDTLLFEDMAACSEGHLFCKICIGRSAEIIIGQGKLAFPCLQNCGKNYSLHLLKVVLKPSVFFKMAQRQQLEEVQAANIAELETCPFCDFGAIPLPTDKVFTCLNTDCMQISCRYCKEPNHIPLRCDELPERDEQVKARTEIEDRMTQALLRECYQCKKKFVKTDGCNKMTCSCGAIMCYLCRQPVTNGYQHFNGQGGDAFDKCALWSKNEELHDKAVQDAAALAREEVLAASTNPQFALKHDPTLLLPG